MNDKTHKLKKSYKGAFPFKLATTSFIYRADYAFNVKMLGPFVDEIELLFFESKWPDSFPSKPPIKELKTLADTLDLTYNVHLPLDIFLGSSSKNTRDTGINAVKRMVALTESIRPTTYTLHLALESDKSLDKDALQAWQDRCSKSIDAILAEGIKGEQITIENIDYPFEWVMPVVDRCGLNICLDTGHLMVKGLDPGAFYKKHQEKIKLIHLHGALGTKDHMAVDRMDRTKINQIKEILDQYRGTVSIEVFSFADLEPSLAYLETLMNF